MIKLIIIALSLLIVGISLVFLEDKIPEKVKFIMVIINTILTFILILK